MGSVDWCGVVKGSALLPVLAAGLTPLLLIGLLIVGSTLGLVLWRPPVLWTDQFGDQDATSNVGHLAAGDSGIYASGFLNTNGTPVGNAFIRKYRADGALVWTTMIPANSALFTTGISLASDGIYIIGDSVSYTLLKYNFDGILLWSKLAEPSVELSAIFATPTNVYAGLTNVTFYGRPIVYVREYDAQGNVIWTSQFPNSTSIVSSVMGIYVGAPEVLILTGLALVAYSLDGSELWAHAFGSPGLVYPLSITGDSTGVYVSGMVRLNGLSPATGFLTKYDFDGNTVWDTAFYSPDQGGVGFTAVSADSSGIYLSMASGRVHDFVQKYDSKGSRVWSFETPLMPKDDFLVATGPNGFYLAGSTGSSQGGWTKALVQAFSGFNSLVFFGINPPFSFAILGSLIAAAVLSIIFLRRRYARLMSRHPKSTSNDRYFKRGGTPPD